MSKKAYILVFLCLMVFVGAYFVLKNRGATGTPNFSDINVSLKIKRLDNDLFSEPFIGVGALKEKYGLFFDLYTEGILDIGKSNSAGFDTLLNAFKTHKSVITAKNEVATKFADISNLSNRLADAFKHYKYYFPAKPIPEVYTCITGFNQSIIIGDNILAIGLDKYVDNQNLYSMLGIYKYLSVNMKPDKIPSDCMYYWLKADLSSENYQDNLISRMIYEGKLLYLTKRMLPNEPDSIIMGYSPIQMEWCEINEENMWRSLIDAKLLFSTDNFTIIKLTEDSPTSSAFPAESPGRACNWLGYRIVSDFMNRNKNVSVEELIKITDPKYIMEKAKYNP